MGYYSFNCGLIGTGKRSYTGVYDIYKAVFSPKFVLIPSTLIYSWWETDTSNHPSDKPGFDAFFSGTPNGTGNHTTNIYWDNSNNRGPKPSYLPTFQFAWQVEGFIYIDSPGTYGFGTSSDDGNQLTINGTVVTSHYGGRGMGGSITNPMETGSIILSSGYHTFRYRMNEGNGSDGAMVVWKQPGNSSFSLLPISRLYSGQKQIGNNITPTDIVLSSTFVSSGAAANSTIATITATDPDSTETFTFSLVSGTGDTDNSSFTITGNSLKINAAPNMSVQSSYSIRIRVTDSQAAILEKYFTMNVTDTIISNGLVLDLDAGKSSSYSGTGTTWTDLSGNGNNGTLVNGVGYDSSNDGILSFDGSNDYVNFASRILTSSTTEISCFLWVYPVSDGVILAILGQSNINTSYHHSSIEIDSSGTLKMVVWPNSNSNRVTSSLTFNTWNYIGYTYSGTTFTGYVNGSSVGTTTFTWNKPSNIYFGIMATDNTNMGTSSYGHGSISSFHVYDRALTATEVTQNFNTLKGRYDDIELSSTFVSTGAAANSTIATITAISLDSTQTFTFSLVSGTGDTDNSSFTITGNSLKINAAPDMSVQSSYSIRIEAVDSNGKSIEKYFTITVSGLVSNGLVLHLDANDSNSYPGSGTIWYDLSSSGNNGTLVNGPTHGVSSSNTGKFNFDEINDYVDCGNVLNQTAYTKSVWFRPESSTANIISGPANHAFWMNNSDNQLASGHQGSWTRVSYTVPSGNMLNQWWNGVVTWNNSTGWVLYVNGVQVDTNSNTDGPGGTTSVYISRYDAGNYFDGDISHVMIYNRALTATEVTQNFNTLKGRFGL